MAIKHKNFNLKTFYAYKFISECLPIYAFYALLFIERGQSLIDVALLIALWNTFALVFEIPTGLLADRINRKTMLVTSCLFKGVCFLVWYISYSFWLFALGFLFWAFASSLTSGTEESLIFDSLKKDGNQDKFTEVYGRVELFATIGALVGITSSGILVNFFSLGSIALISASISLIDALFAINLRGLVLYRETNTKAKETISGTLHSAVNFIKLSKVAPIIIAFIVLVVSLGAYLDEFDALIIADFELDLYWVTVILVIRLLFMVIGDILAPIAEKYITSFRGLIGITGIGCLLLGLFAWMWKPLALIIFGFPFMIFTMVNVILINKLNQEIKEEARATIMSVIRVGQSLGMIILALIFGWLTCIVGMQQTYLIIVGFGIVCSILFALALNPLTKKVKK